MINGATGELISLVAVAGWTVSALSFEGAGRRVGSIPVNILRLALAAIIIALVNLLRGFTPWPPGVTSTQALWLMASGFVGFFLGDLLLFRSFLSIGARLAMLVMSLSPPISALLDGLVFGQGLNAGDGLGMSLAVLGVALAATARTKNAAGPPTATKSRRWLGFLLAFGGALGQSGGMILGKLGMGTHDPLAATFLRTLGGMAGFIPLVLLTGATGRVIKALGDGKAMSRLSLGTIAGPVIGVSAVLLALRYSPAGVVSSITAVVPVVIILPSMVFMKDKPQPREILGAIVAVSGVAVLFLT